MSWAEKVRGATSHSNPTHLPASSAEKVSSETDVKPLDSPLHTVQTSARGSSSAAQLAEELSSALEEDGMCKFVSYLCTGC